MRILLLSVLLAFSWPLAAQEKKAEKKPATKTVTKKADSKVAPAKAGAQKKAEPKKAQTKKTVEPSQDWGRFNTASKKDLEKIEQDKAAKKK